MSFFLTPSKVNLSLTNRVKFLIDYSGSGQGIRKMSEQAIQSQPLQLIDTLTQLTRVVTGSTEVMTGETLGAGMSGAAIAQLQSQAQQPVEELKDAFWLVKEKKVRSILQTHTEFPSSSKPRSS